MNNILTEKPGSNFICRYCGRTVSTIAPGTKNRNHCPWCLRSLHMDNQTGDRSSPCGSIMEPIAISVKKSGEWLIIHRCVECGALRENRIAGDDNEVALLSLAVRPVAEPPFPLDNILSNNNIKIKE
jgi:hypothetical protein